MALLTYYIIAFTFTTLISCSVVFKIQHGNKFNIELPHNYNNLKTASKLAYTLCVLFAILIVVAAVLNDLYSFVDSPLVYWSLYIVSFLLASHFCQEGDKIVNLDRNDSDSLLGFAELNNDVKDYISKVNKTGREITSGEYHAIRTYFYDEVRKEHRNNISLSSL